MTVKGKLTLRLKKFQNGIQKEDSKGESKGGSKRGYKRGSKKLYGAKKENHYVVHMYL